jgi:hypothetical protein
MLINPKEIDILIPSRKLAIEFNGLFYHSERCISDPHYHTNKSRLTASKGYRLLHVFEDEWRDKREIVKSALCHSLGVTANKINARDCVVREMTSAEAKVFHDATHIDGGLASRHAWGLFLNNAPVACMSVRRPWSKSHGDGVIEIARFSSQLDTSVRGGLQKLLSAVSTWAKQQGFNKMLSYVDTRFGQGHSYEAAGFKHVGDTDERFWWTDNFKRYNRFKYKADASRGMSENQVAEESGVSRIYGCPNRILILDI